MRYDDFRDRWQAALHAAGVLSHQDRPQETIDVSTTERRWRLLTLPRTAGPFNVLASVGFHWDPFQSARSYTREEDLLTELLGRRARWSTQHRLVRVDIKLHAKLPYGSTTPLPAADVWQPWIASMEDKVSAALAPRQRTNTDIRWRGGLGLEGESSVHGEFALHGMSVPAYEMIVVPRIWDDPRRREREASAAKPIHALAARFRTALAAWTGSVAELVGWLHNAPAPPHGRSGRRRREPFQYDDDGGPETTLTIPAPSTLSDVTVPESRKEVGGNPEGGV